MSIERFIENLAAQEALLRREYAKPECVGARKGAITRKLNEISKIRVKAARAGLKEIS